MFLISRTLTESTESSGQDRTGFIFKAIGRDKAAYPGISCLVMLHTGAHTKTRINSRTYFSVLTTGSCVVSLERDGTGRDLFLKNGTG